MLSLYMASHPRRLLVLEQHYANSLKSKMRIWKYFCSSVYTGQSHWRGSIGAIFLPVQCYWEVTAIWNAHINLQLTSPSLGLSFHSTKHGHTTLMCLGPLCSSKEKRGRIV
ncbi:hypothetical protein NC653_024109 [Populus alba x Populus x berolinensis]|uniref:Uncharacterized protein n=1 Tax=Populus alba x Populus x berolinensis TaxID=444605 RepID=A0AAD6M842_9ROSI|nr:hypothetical protein NC653_024109 [Populus alba x Populus x berolinensis]